MTQPLPQTGDPVVDEVIRTFQDCSGRSLAERAEAALQAQRGLQARLTDSAPAAAPDPGSSWGRPSDAGQVASSAAALARVATTGRPA